jgi:integrase
VGLRRRDVDALRGELLVDEAIKEVTAASAAKVPDAQRITPSLIVGPTKTYAKRKVSVSAFLQDELAAHLGRSLPGGDGPEAFIFTTPTGEPIRHNLFYKRVFSPAVRQAFPGRALRFHDLRHTCAAWLIEANAHPLQIKLRLGHKEIRTTMDTYGHLFPSAEPEMAGLLDAAYRDAEPTNVVALDAGGRRV